MKKLTALLLVFILLLAACGNRKTADGDGGRPDEFSGPPTSFIENIVWQDHDVYESFYDLPTSKDPLVNFSASLPLTQNNDVIKEYYSKKESALRQSASALLDLAKDDYDRSKDLPESFFAPFEMEVTYSVQRNDSRVFSVALSTYENTGGPHPNNTLTGDSFETQTGTLITADALFTVPLSEALEKIKPAITAEMDKRSAEYGFDLYYPNVSDDPFAVWEKTDFYFSEDKLVFVWQTYSLAPHAVGIQEFSIPLSDLSGILDAKWTLS